MESTSVINQVVNNLQQHPESVRIKKLIFLATKNVWLSDKKKLEQLNVNELLEELISAKATRGSLKESLYCAAGTLNKKTEYILIANTILSLVGEVFSEGVTSHQSVTTPQVDGGQQAPIPAKVSSFPKDKNDLFDIKLDILRYTNPLRAKIVIFSTLYHQFQYTDAELSLLKRQELDDLIVKLYRACPTVVQLKNKLNNTVKSMKIAENTQVSETIFLALRGYYSAVPGDELDATASWIPEHQASNEEGTNLLDDDDDEDETCQLTNG